MLMKPEALNPFDKYSNLADYRFGCRVLSVSDDFFAEKENLIKPNPAIFLPEEYTDRGKWMDGWESRRKRTTGHDWCVLRLGLAGVIYGIDADTSHFLGNAPQEVSLEAAYSKGMPTEKDWLPILKKSKVKVGSHNFFAIKNLKKYNYVRIHIYPDGGLARLRVYGIAELDRTKFVSGELVDLAAADNGACAINCSDMFFGDKKNLLMPNRPINMGDGWETKRSRRKKGGDWNIIRLAASGIPRKVIVDTTHFKGNFPDTFSLEGIQQNKNTPNEKTPDEKTRWKTIIEQTKLKADERRIFITEIKSGDAVFNYAKFNIFPDGGVGRLNIFCELV